MALRSSGPLVPGFVHAPYANCYRCPVAATPETCGVECLRFIEEQLLVHQLERRSLIGLTDGLLCEIDGRVEEEDLALYLLCDMSKSTDYGNPNKAYYVKQVAAHGLPPCGVLTEVTIKRHEKYQFTLSFKMIGKVEGEYMPEILAKVDTIQEDLFAPYQNYDAVDDEEEEAPKKSKAIKGKAKPAARKSIRKKASA